MQDLIDHYFKYGWVVIDLLDANPVWEARAALQSELEKIVQQKHCLDEYHLNAEEDEVQTELQMRLASFFHENRVAKEIIGAPLHIFKKLVAVDLLVQKKPYLLMTRPFKKQD